MNENIPFREIATDLLSRYPADNRLHLRLGDAAIEVRSNSLALLEQLGMHFKEFLGSKEPADMTVFALEGSSGDWPFAFEEKQPDPGKIKVKEEFVDLDGGRIVRKKLTGIVLLFGGDRHVAVGPCLNNVNQVINFINNRFIEWMLKKGSLLAHAAGVFIGNRGLALAGFSGSGKSTLALQLLCTGTSFVSNDRLMIQRQAAGLMMYGIAKHPRVNPGTLLSLEGLQQVMTPEDREAARQMEPDELWNLESKHDVIVHEHFGANHFKLAAPLHGLLILNWRRTRESLVVSEVRIADRSDLLEAFIKSPGLFFLPAADHPRPDFSANRYIDILKDCAVFEATGGVDYAGAVRFCRSFLEKDSHPHQDRPVSVTSETRRGR